MSSEFVVAIVDDDASVRKALGRLLLAHRIKSRSYPSAQALLDTLPLDVPNCLIVDVEMPDMTGLDLQRELSNAGFRIPTIVITGNDDRRVAASAASLGAAAFLLKPLVSDALIAAVISAGKEDT
jgi:FixJ family two-component response regulator